jgi:hypothetical protein
MMWTVDKSQIDNLLVKLVEALRPQVELRERHKLMALTLEASKYDSWKKKFVWDCNQLQGNPDGTNRKLDEKDQTLQDLRERWRTGRMT